MFCYKSQESTTTLRRRSVHFLDPEIGKPLLRPVECLTNLFSTETYIDVHNEGFPTTNHGRIRYMLPYYLLSETLSLFQNLFTFIILVLKLWRNQKGCLIPGTDYGSPVFCRETEIPYICQVTKSIHSKYWSS